MRQILDNFVVSARNNIWAELYSSEMMEIEPWLSRADFRRATEVVQANMSYQI